MDAAEIEEITGVDIGEHASNPNNVFLLADRGGFGFEWRGPGYYEAHSFFAPGSRGTHRIRSGREALDIMRDEYGAVFIWGGTPLDNVAARVFNKACGFALIEKRWLPERGDCGIYLKRLI
jgi:hypothetical protein